MDEKVYQPGDRLREQELADRFGTSRGPIREALRSLEAKSLVRIEPMRGATVTRLSDEDARDMVEIAGALFGLMMAKAAEASDLDLGRAEKALGVLGSMVSDETSSRDFFEQTVRIGARIVSEVGHGQIARALANARIGAPDMFGHFGFSTLALKEQSFEKWARLIKAIRSGDALTARQMGEEVHHDALMAALKIVA